MSEGKFGEPWLVDEDPIRFALQDSFGNDIAYSVRNDRMRLGQLDRARDAVNAFANVEDPAADLARLRRVEEKAINLSDYLIDDDVFDGLRPKLQGLVLAFLKTTVIDGGGHHA